MRVSSGAKLQSATYFSTIVFTRPVSPPPVGIPPLLWPRDGWDECNQIRESGCDSPELVVVCQLVGVARPEEQVETVSLCIVVEVLTRDADVRNNTRHGRDKNLHRVVWIEGEYALCSRTDGDSVTGFQSVEQRCQVAVRRRHRLDEQFQRLFKRRRYNRIRSLDPIDAKCAILACFECIALGLGCPHQPEVGGNLLSLEHGRGGQCRLCSSRFGCQTYLLNGSSFHDASCGATIEG